MGPRGPDPSSPGRDDHDAQITRRIEDATTNSLHPPDTPDAAQPVPCIEPPPRVGRYELLRRIGSGGMGDVYEARHCDHGLRAAVKLIHRRVYLSADCEAVPLEFAVLARLRHRNIVSVLDCGSQPVDGHPPLQYLVMSYIPGALPITRAAQDMNLWQRLELFRQACDALSYLHRSGHLHLDVKPANLLVDADGCVFLADFGMARPAVDWSDPSISGTRLFMSPEQLSGQADPIGPASDVWAMGAVLHRLLSGEDPFGSDESASCGARLLAVRTAPRSLELTARSLAQVSSAMRSRLERLIARCLAFEPKDRFSDAEALRREVVDLIRWRGVAERLIAFRRSRPAGWRAGVTVAAATLATACALLITTPLVHMYGRPIEWMDGLLPPPAASLARHGTLDDLVILEFDGDTADTLAGLDGLSDFVPGSDRMSLRPMHAALIERLADFGVRCVVVDIFFSHASPHDALVAAAVRSARERGMPVVLGVNSWDWYGDRPTMSDEIWNAGPRWGAATMGYELGVFWADLLVLREGIDPMPGLAMAAYAAVRDPEGFPEYSMDGSALRIRSFRPDPMRPEQRLYRQDSERHVPSWAGRFRPGHGPAFGMRRGDQTVVHAFTLPPESAFEAATLPYAAVWTAPPDELRRQLAGKIVVLADRELDRVVTGTSVRGARTHAAALQSMLMGFQIRLGTAWSVPLTLVSAWIAAMVVMASAGRGAARPMRVAASRVAAVAGAIVAAGGVVLSVAIVAHEFGSVRLYLAPSVVAAIAASLMVAALLMWLPAERRA